MSLKENDLVHMLDHIFEIDSYASKMGEDSDIVTLSFSLNDKSAAEDLSGFLERGYAFILDSDVTPGEQSDGAYRVFVEIERNRKIGEQITEILDGVGKLAGNEKPFKFRYYKNFRSQEATLENLETTIPKKSDEYGVKVNETRIENYKEFFNNSYVENINLNDDLLIISKKYADPLAFEFINFGDTLNIIESIEGKFDLMESYPEILFLTKYIGDYNISKYGDKLVFENENKALVLKRI
jgi:hypothetical protein